jgi:adenine C2-methylase RlmN of 23S rRNA A2503 and tRNA A37
MSPKMKAYKLKKMVLTWYHYGFNNNERKRKHLPKRTRQLMKQRAKDNYLRLMKERES